MELLIAFVWTPVSCSVAITSAPGTAAPAGSVILPLIRPVWLCAKAAAAHKKSTVRRFIESQYNKRYLP